MQIVPLQAGVPNQTLTTTLGDQSVQINLYQKATGLFLDLYLLPGTLVLAGALCRNLRPIVISPYLGFIGDLMFADLRGAQDPDYTGLGERYILSYLTAADIP